MILVPVISQQDSRWANILLGFSFETIKSFGCTLACLTALAGRNNVAEANELFKQNGVYTNGNLVTWNKVSLAFPNLKFVYRYYVYDNNKVSDYVYNKNTPVLVEVDAAPIGAPRSSHWILYVGDRMCLDPWLGKLRKTADYPIVKGFVLYDIVQPVLTDADRVNRIRGILNRPDINDSQKVIESLKITG